MQLLLLELDSIDLAALTWRRVEGCNEERCKFIPALIKVGKKTGLILRTCRFPMSCGCILCLAAHRSIIVRDRQISDCALLTLPCLALRCWMDCHEEQSLTEISPMLSKALISSTAS